MIVVLEGADNSGKSTLAKKLSSEFSIEVVHPGGPPKNISDALLRCNEQAIILNSSDSVSFVYDRITCISDFVYRGNTRYNKIFRQYQNHLRYAPDLMIIYCRPSDERLLKFDDHVMQDHEDESVVEHAKLNVHRTIATYDELFSEFERDQKMNIRRFDFETESHESFIERCFDQVIM